MLQLSAENQDALEAGGLDARDFVSFFVKNRDTRDVVEDHLWSDVGNVIVPVINPATGISQDRNFSGAYGIVEIDAIPRVHNISVQTINIKLSYVSNRVNALFRQYDAKFGRVEIFRGLYIIGTRQLAAPAFPRFVGFINEITVNIPAEDDVGDITFSCTSHTAELMRVNYETRSYESQLNRLSGDEFYKDTATIGDREFFWGRNSGKVTKDNK